MKISRSGISRNFNAFSGLRLTNIKFHYIFLKNCSFQMYINIKLSIYICLSVCLSITKMKTLFSKQAKINFTFIRIRLVRFTKNNSIAFYTPWILHKIQLNYCLFEYFLSTLSQDDPIWPLLLFYNTSLLTPWSRLSWHFPGLYTSQKRFK